jgi:hypothetical protein
MAGYRTPGAIGIGANHPVIDEGTSARVQMFATGSLGIATPVPVALDQPVTQAVDAPVAQITQAPVAQTTPKRGCRDMTAGEIAMSKSVFKDSIDYRKVKINNGGYFWGYQSRKAMAPDGAIYYWYESFKEDFSSARADDRHTFIHEMVHVWQCQLGYNVRWHGLQRWKLKYEYALSHDGRLCDYDMEQQGEIIADYFALSVLKDPTVVRDWVYADMERLPLFESVLQDFFKNPSDKNNLPK